MQILKKKRSLPMDRFAALDGGHRVSIQADESGRIEIYTNNGHTYCNLEELCAALKPLYTRHSKILHYEI